MNYTRCYDSMIELVEEASDKFGEGAMLNESKFDSLKYICKVTDRFIEDRDTEKLDFGEPFNQFKEDICDDKTLYEEYILAALIIYFSFKPGYF